MDHYNTHGLSQTLSKIPLIAQEDVEPDSLTQFLNKALMDYPDLLAVEKGYQSRSQLKNVFVYGIDLMIQMQLKIR